MNQKYKLVETALLEQTKEINDTFEQLRMKMLNLGYSETSGFVRLAQTSFEHELFQRIKRG